jgi:hypothetical protein
MQIGRIDFDEGDSKALPSPWLLEATNPRDELDEGQSRPIRAIGLGLVLSSCLWAAIFFLV